MSLTTPTLLALLATPLAFGTCQPGTPSSGGLDDGDVQAVPPVRTDCDARATDPVDVDYAYVDGDDLVVGVAYSGGCADHAFDACWDGAWIKTLPMQVDLALAHDAGGDACREYIEEELVFDLTPVADQTTAAFGEYELIVNLGDHADLYTW